MNKLQKKILTVYTLLIALILLVTITLLILNWSHTRDHVKIGFRFSNGPSPLKTSWIAGYQKYPARGAILGDAEAGSGKMTFTVEALNHPLNLNEIEQLEFDIDTLLVTDRRILKSNANDKETSASGAIWLKNTSGFNSYYFYQFNTKRSNFLGDYIWSMNDPEILKSSGVEKGPAIFKIDDLPNFLSTDLMSLSGATYIETPESRYICLIGESWKRETDSDSSATLSKEKGYAACYLKTLSGQSSVSQIFKLPDMFRIQMDMASLDDNIGVIALDVEDKTIPMFFYPGKVVESPSAPAAIDFSEKTNGLPVSIRERIDGRNIETSFIVANRIDNGYYVFWMEMETGYDWSKARKDILTGCPGLSFFSRSLMISKSADGGKTFSEPIRATGHDYFLDGCFTTTPDGDIYVLYITTVKNKYIAKIRVMPHGSNDFKTCYIFSEKIPPGIVPVEPMMKIAQKKDGTKKIIIVAKIGAMNPYTDYNVLSLDEIPHR